MIVRTPPPPKRPRADGDGQLVIYEDPPESSPSEHMLCTYQCRQMVCFSSSSFHFYAIASNNTYFIFLRQVKSDFIDALSKAENQARHYQSKFETLEPNFHKLGQSNSLFILIISAFLLTVVNLLQNLRGRNFRTNSYTPNRNLQLQKAASRHSKTNS